MKCIIFHNLLMIVSVNVRTKIPLDNCLTEEKFLLFFNKTTIWTSALSQVSALGCNSLVFQVDGYMYILYVF